MTTRVDPGQLNATTRLAIMKLKEALAYEPGFRHVQVTFDDVKVMDVPPTIDVLIEID